MGGGVKSDNKVKTRPDKLYSFAASWTGNENIVQGRKMSKIEKWMQTIDKSWRSNMI